MEHVSNKGRAIIVGGSIAGLSCAHALILAGWDVVVLEKACGLTKGSPTGAGLGLDSSSLQVVESWLGTPSLLHHLTLPITIDQNQATNRGTKATWVLTRDEEFNFRAAHWADLHDLLHNKLPPNTVLWGHHFVSFRISKDKNLVKVEAKVLETDQIVEIDGNLLVAADGCLSSIRSSFLPDTKLRYSGYSAWRGVFDYSGKEDSETVIGIKKCYPELGNCLYFDIASGSHCVLYELLNKRINWIWYVTQPEPHLKGNSTTTKVSIDMVNNMCEEANKVWSPELARVMKETKEPFLNLIYDSDPLPQICWDNVVLIGDAAHPTTPHCLRSTNMSIVDAAVLGKCLEKWGVNDLSSALKEFQSIRLPVVSKQVLHARRVGRIKQGLDVSWRKAFDAMSASSKECEEIQQKNLPFFATTIFPMKQ